jgi:hypothetical protein
MKKEIRYIQDVPIGYFEYCLKKATDERVRKELEEIIEQFKRNRHYEGKILPVNDVISEIKIRRD